LLLVCRGQWLTAVASWATQCAQAWPADVLTGAAHAAMAPTHKPAHPPIHRCCVQGTYMVRLGAEAGGVIVSLRPDKASQPGAPALMQLIHTLYACMQPRREDEAAAAVPRSCPATRHRPHLPQLLQASGLLTSLACSLAPSAPPLPLPVKQTRSAPLRATLAACRLPSWQRLPTSWRSSIGCRSGASFGRAPWATCLCPQPRCACTAASG
jgi:hypothetical protein